MAISYETDWKDPWNRVCHVRGLSTDTKPTNVGDNSDFLEVDTMKVYFFNKTTKVWSEG